MAILDKYAIKNTTIVSRILPYFLRGRNIMRFFYGISAPLISVHNSFLSWAEEQIFKCNIMFQTKPMEWYINHVLGKYYLYPDDKCHISLYITLNNYPYIDYAEESQYADIYVYEHTESQKPSYIYQKKEASCDIDGMRFNIGMPAHTSDISDEEYLTMGRQIIAQYSCFTQYSLLIID